MSEIYNGMWQRLGLNLEAHHELLKTLGVFYSDIYLSQKDRPKAMEYFDFVMSEVHGLRIQELQEAKANGRRVIGTFCVFVPEELILAVDGVCIGLCAGAEVGIYQAEQYLPRNTCSLIKSFFGFKLAGLCPFTNSCDLVIGETTCDGKKKAYEIFGGFQPVYVMEVPQTKSEAAHRLYESEVVRLKDHLEAVSGKKITVKALNQAIRLVNRRRRGLQRLNRLRFASPAPVSGLDALLVNQVAFYDDPVRVTEAIERLCDEIEDRIKANQGVKPVGAKRILVSGCPMAIPNWKIPMIVEQAGAVIVGEESCVGERHTKNTVKEDLTDLNDILHAIARRYMQIDCATFTPNEERMDHIIELVRKTEAQGVIHYAIQFCQPYTIEAKRVEERLRLEGIQYLRIETDYSLQDLEALKTRIEAFLETL
ncbi:double-cubane-cluster-containing anaerobic reductase [Dissulfurimicrobium hydrothermale]|uniref:double-cubane-cluster-containing anaerobic reductase n=1 Tax=Dissulfurimicrobium hydrothermale TaxID=1750598 RepID=UPI001EDC6991|nr:double-cubane-cluster-containing anaerobic reductase [Dissulfurimicrobium hydrothermale]UKL13238.1 2-hydroxyacyl-CoA dehydratase family protein [Dissulfurimicrobium hydrothermale]